ncbi:MAG: response regulator [Microcystaceae cyanobacterium]
METKTLINLPIVDTPEQVLNTLIANRATGKLTIQNPRDEFVTWQVYLGNGKINFANSGVGSVERLNYLLGGYFHQQKIQLPPQIVDDYAYICGLWKENLISFQQTRSILTQATNEALVQILSLPQTTCSFDSERRLKDLFLNLDLDKIVIPLQSKINYWWQIRSEVNSPFQRPMVDDWEKLKTIFKNQHDRSEQWIQQFSDGLRNLSCLYEIAGQTQTSTLPLALMLRPQIKSGDIKMLSYQQIQVDNRPVVICVDDREAIQLMVQATLEPNGFKAIAIQDPFKALAIAMSQKPSLILIDVAMPEMNGYELCRLLRQSISLQNIPIILLTEKKGLVERIQGKLAGAAGYLDKPFLPQELLALVKSQTTPSQSIKKHRSSQT